MKTDKEKEKEEKLTPKQLVEATRQQKIMFSLKEEPKGLRELQYDVAKKLGEDVELIPKSTISAKIQKLKSAGLVRSNIVNVKPNELSSPRFRGWRQKEKLENGSVDLEYGFTLTPQGDFAIKVLEEYVELEPSLDKKKKKKED